MKTQQLSLGEMIKEIQTAKAVEDKAALLRKYECPVLRDVVRMIHDPSVVFALKKGPYEYHESRDNEDQTELIPEWRRIKRLFIQGNYPRLDQAVREKNFTGLLGCLSHVERELIMGLKDRNVKGIPREAVAIAFPGLLPNPK